MLLCPVLFITRSVCRSHLQEHPASLPGTFISGKQAISQECHGNFKPDSVGETALLCQWPLKSMCARTHSLYLQFHFSFCIFFSLPPIILTQSYFSPKLDCPYRFFVIQVILLIHPNKGMSPLNVHFLFIFTAVYHLVNQVGQFPLSCVGMSKWVLGSHFPLKYKVLNYQQ